MALYYVNKNAQANGDHEVHTTGCSFMPLVENRILLGDFTNCQHAVAKSKRDYYSQSNGCYYCAKPCHTG